MLRSEWETENHQNVNYGNGYTIGQCPLYNIAGRLLSNHPSIHPKTTILASKLGLTVNVSQWINSFRKKMLIPSQCRCYDDDIVWAGNQSNYVGVSVFLCVNATRKSTLYLKWVELSLDTTCMYVVRCGDNLSRVASHSYAWLKILMHPHRNCSGRSVRIAWKTDMH